MLVLALSPPRRLHRLLLLLLLLLLLCLLMHNAATRSPLLRLSQPISQLILSTLHRLPQCHLVCCIR